MNINSHKYIHQFLEDSTALYPDKVALIYQKQRITYKEINNRANSLARKFIEWGITKGERAVLILENSLEYVVGYYSTLKAGAVAIPLSADIKESGLEFVVTETKPKIVITSSRFEKILKSGRIQGHGVEKVLIKNPKLNWSDASFKVISWDEIVNNKGHENPGIPIEENSLASIIYTSGSMGKPKGAMLSHKNIVSNTDAICQYLELSDYDIQMVVLPFFYVMGKSLLNTHFAVGGTVVINNTFLYPTTVLKQMVEERVTGFSGVPSTYAHLLHRSPLSSYRDKLSHLRYCSQAGGHMAKQLKIALRQALPDHTKIFIMYGATEASARLTYLDPIFYESKMDSVGKAIPEMTIKIMGDQGSELPAGSSGELVVQGPSIMAGYWKDRETTSKVLDAQGYHTGDLGYKDQDGFIFITGRKDNQLKVGGHRINTQEIEDAILETGLVIETFVLGYPDKLLGHKLSIVAVSKGEEISGQTIRAACAQRLPRYKVPETIVLVSSLPKKLSGKIDKEKCLEIIKKSISPADNKINNNIKELT
jgi:acyl-CoA synthetase (AMP-forming)/AMP-acid ligase II